MIKSTESNGIKVYGARVQRATGRVREKTGMSPLDAWVGERIGRPDAAHHERAVAEWQALHLRRTLRRVREASPWHAARLAGVPEPENIAGLADLPFTTEADLREHGQAMLCVSRDQVARVVTMSSSGTTGLPKRLYFSDADIESTLDFFHHGMRSLFEDVDGIGDYRPRSTIILLPGETPDSVGDLLRRALERLDVRGRVHGLAPDPFAALEAAVSVDADCVVGFPVQVLAMARAWERHVAQGTGKGLTAWSGPRRVLLCSDYVPISLRREVERIWGGKRSCRVFAHWGSVESGLGGGVECGAHVGMHLREADLAMEIVEPNTGEVLRPGLWGEIVLTTLTREAMPLIRYRTGDMGRLMPGVCKCGSAVRRLDAVLGRLGSRYRIAPGRVLFHSELDEALFGLDGVLDFTAALEMREGRPLLRVHLAVWPGSEQSTCAVAQRRLLPVLGCKPHGVDRAAVGLCVSAAPWEDAGISPGKRILEDRRNHA